jgi:hypothetical protein
MPVNTNKLFVCIHEWGGYESSRQKTVKGVKPFTCGLAYQLNRFKSYSGKYELKTTLTMSDPQLCKNRETLRNSVDNFVEVDNLGMDFSGYNAFYQMIKDMDNSYVILTNSSVNSLQTDFIDSYIDYLDKNKDVGLLGVSYSSKYAHTLIRNNFNPHIQSFFLMTTISVLNQIVSFNNNKFLGVGERNKHLLIRNGEVLISRIALKLGYNLAVVTENGVTKFNYRDYPLQLGDYRWYTQYPNAVFPINEVSSPNPNILHT